MSSICKCGAEGVNFGQPNCVEIFSRSKRVVLVPLIDSDGNKNSIAASDLPLDSTYFTTEVNEVYDKRWQPLPVHTNYQDERDDPFTEDIEGVPYYTADGNKMISFDLIGKKGAPAVKKQIDSSRCQNWGFYLITYNDEIVGAIEDDNFDTLYPIPVQSGTMSAKFTSPRKEAISRVTVQFMVEETFMDGDLSFIQADQITGLSTLRALSDAVFLNTTANSTTEIEFNLNFAYFGTVGDQQPVTGITDETEITVYNNTSSSAVTPSAISESTTVPGFYTLTIPAQTTADELVVDLDKEGYEADQVTVTVP